MGIVYRESRIDLTALMKSDDRVSKNAQALMFQQGKERSRMLRQPREMVYVDVVLLGLVMQDSRDQRESQYCLSFSHRWTDVAAECLMGTGQLLP